jgi:hypothetical protein
MSDDLLSRALVRAASGQQAFLGKMEKGADAVVQAYFYNARETELELAGTELIELVEQADDKLKDFLGFVFEHATVNTPLLPEIPAKKALAPWNFVPDAAEKEDKAVRKGLIFMVQAKLVEWKWVRLHSDGSIVHQDNRPRALAQVALEAKNLDDIFTGFAEEGFDRKCLDHANDSSTVDKWARWLWGTVCELRNEYRDGIAFDGRKVVDADAEADGDAKEDEPDQDEPAESSSEDPISAFLPKDEGLKPGQIYVPGYFGQKINTWDENLPYCKRPKNQTSASAARSFDPPALSAGLRRQRVSLGV